MLRTGVFLTRPEPEQWIITEHLRLRHIERRSARHAEPHHLGAQVRRAIPADPWKRRGRTTK